MTDASEGEDGYLAETVRNSVVDVAAFTAGRLLLAGVAHVVTTVLGAASYGFLSVFARGGLLAWNSVDGPGDG